MLVVVGSQSLGSLLTQCLGSLLACLGSVLLLTSVTASQEVETDLFPLLMPMVHPTAPESYICTPVRLDTDVTYSVVGFKPNASMHTAHHILVYGCEEPGSKTAVWNCGEMAAKDPNLESHAPCSTGPQIIYAWAKDAPELRLPEGVGFRVGAGTDIKYLVLQVHYATTDKIPATGDDSGVHLLFTEKLQPKTAGVLLMGTGGFAPAKTTTYFETSCEIEDTRRVHPFAFRVHTHGLGKVVSGWQVRDNSWKLLGKKSPQVPQMFYPVEDNSTVLEMGDTVAARCTMVNDKTRTVYVGMTNEDEMCNFYIMYWVEGRQPIEPNTCFSRGPPTWSWGSPQGGGLSNIPDLSASTL